MKKHTVSGTPHAMKSLNKRLILQTIRRKQPVSRVEISQETAISRTTVSQLIDELMAEGIVREVGVGSAAMQGGRKPIQLCIDDDAAYVAGVDIGGSGTTMAVCNLAGEVVVRRRFSTRTRETLDQLIAELKDFFERLPVPRDKLVGLGVGAPGITRFSDGMVLAAPSLGWTEVPLKRMLEEQFQLPVYVDNDVNLAALGEAWLGAGQGKRHLIMVTVGTGIGCGLILNGDLYRGSGWASGEIGYMVTDAGAVEHWDDPVYEGFGFMESKAGGPAILRQYVRQRQPDDPGAPPDLPRWTAKEVFEAARNGDPTALSVIGEAGKHLAAGIANAVILFDPEVVVLGGGLFKSANLLLPMVKEMVERTPMRPEICVSGLGEDAGVLGGGALVLKEHQGVFQGVL